MTKVITYGTYDHLHYGHVLLLERAKALGDYLIVGVTADDFDRRRGKINVQQSLMERVEAVRRTGLADEIIVEEYEGQKIDDIKRYGIDVFTVGSDWEGHFDYLSEYCRVVYLDRTEGISSSEIRSQKSCVRLGIVGQSTVVPKFVRESRCVNGIEIVGMYSRYAIDSATITESVPYVAESYDDLLDKVDAVYVISHPSCHYDDIMKALQAGKHVMCESPIAVTVSEAKALYDFADSKGLVLFDATKTAYSTAFQRLILLAKGGCIGDIVSVDAVCTSLRQVNYTSDDALARTWSSMTGWGPTALLPILELLGQTPSDVRYYTRMGSEEHCYDEFTQATLVYPSSVATIKVGKGVKSEGELIVSGTKGYIYVPAPWWLTDYFEIRYENQTDNKRHFYQLDGEGLRNELLAFVRMINGNGVAAISKKTSLGIVDIVEQFEKGVGVTQLVK